MQAFRSMVAMIAIVGLTWLSALASAAAEPSVSRSEDVLRGWYKLTLALIRHTPTYSPPVASRSLAYLGVTAFEAVASGDAELRSLAGQLNGLTAPPPREAGKAYDDAMVLEAALAFAVESLFSNTGPTGQRAMAALEDKLRAEVGRPCRPTSRRAAKPTAIQSASTF